MLSDHDPNKWSYPAHTKAKHAILIRYMKAWLSILGGGARAAGYLANLVIVDAFAGRGRYTTDDPGSPLLLRDITGRVISDRRVDQVELFYIENDVENCAALRNELAFTEPLPGVVERGPFQDTFESAAPEIIREVRGSHRSSFWVIDPFGYAGLPLTPIREILTLPRAEVFITLMVRDMRRFLTNPTHQQAIARVLDLYGDDLAAAIERVEQSTNGMQTLRDIYVERLEMSAVGSRQLYVTSVRAAEDGPADTVYYLVHASTVAKGKREMQEAIWEVTGGLNAVLGTKDPTLIAETIGQIDMFSATVQREMRVPYSTLRDLLSAYFADRRVEYEHLQNEVAKDHVFDGYIESHVKKALEDLANAGAIGRFRDNLPSKRALQGKDVLIFPPA